MGSAALLLHDVYIYVFCVLYAKVSSSSDSIVIIITTTMMITLFEGRRPFCRVGGRISIHPKATAVVSMCVCVCVCKFMYYTAHTTEYYTATADAVESVKDGGDGSGDRETVDAGDKKERKDECGRTATAPQRIASAPTPRPERSDNVTGN